MMSFGTVPGCRQQKKWLSTDVHMTDLQKTEDWAFRETIPCVDLSTGDLSLSTGTPCQEPVCSVCADLSTDIRGAVDRNIFPVPYKICLCRAVDMHLLGCRQESLGLYEVGKKVGETVDGQLQRLTQGCRAVLAEEPGAEADQDLRRFLILLLGKLLFATRGDTVHCRFLPLLEDLDEVGDYAWGAAFLAHDFDSLGASERQTSTSSFFPFLQVWA
ncbi:hypothetical protein Taro_020098 [Colocasia esculenta]|uniref:Aminotransferase-like plant mobile domain-containing protein n=1 Tax=Colocasia esculenta TaxID=4460 RepID=A0A843V1D2_COLES|nr:hypothetical protein [Colocasia esculenta]